MRNYWVGNVPTSQVGEFSRKYSAAMDSDPTLMELDFTAGSTRVPNRNFYGKEDKRLEDDGMVGIYAISMPTGVKKARAFHKSQEFSVPAVGRMSMDDHVNYTGVRAGNAYMKCVDGGLNHPDFVVQAKGFKKGIRKLNGAGSFETADILRKQWRRHNNFPETGSIYAYPKDGPFKMEGKRGKVFELKNGYDHKQLRGALVPLAEWKTVEAEIRGSFAAGQEVARKRGRHQKKKIGTALADPSKIDFDWINRRIPEAMVLPGSKIPGEYGRTDKKASGDYEPQPGSSNSTQGTAQTATTQDYSWRGQANRKILRGRRRIRQARLKMRRYVGSGSFQKKVLPWVVAGALTIGVYGGSQLANRPGPGRRSCPTPAMYHAVDSTSIGARIGQYVDIHLSQINELSNTGKYLSGVGQMGGTKIHFTNLDVPETCRKSGRIEGFLSESRKLLANGADLSLLARVTGKGSDGYHVDVVNLNWANAPGTLATYNGIRNVTR